MPPLSPSSNVESIRWHVQLDIHSHRFLTRFPLSDREALLSNSAFALADEPVRWFPEEQAVRLIFDGIQLDLLDALPVAKVERPPPGGQDILHLQT